MITNKKNVNCKAKPIMKWAGGKTQLLPELLPLVPDSYGKYIEPFFGGGALFFALAPGKAVIADSNPELVNLYTQIATNVENVINYLSQYRNDKTQFLKIRALRWESLSPAEAAARTLFLNKTCFNGLYRVNKKGDFNVPFGNYKNPNICDAATIREASEVLQGATIICGDYLQVLKDHAEPGDFIFLDPPYLPISEYSDFKRYTKEQFYDDDHIALARCFEQLFEKGCHLVLTNSNHPLVYDLYSRFDIRVIQTKRYISSNADKRTGEDVIVNAPARKMTTIQSWQNQVALYPATRYMGSKSKLLAEIQAAASRFEFKSAIDLFAGSGIVGYMFKAMGKSVLSNDYMVMSSTFAKAMIENSFVTLSEDEAKQLLISSGGEDGFVSKTFKGLYFSDSDNALIDTLRVNIKNMMHPYKRAIAMTALIRACIKKRPRGIFTYTGDRYDDGRKDLQKSFADHFLDAVALVNKAVFDNGQKNTAVNGDAMSCQAENPDLVYIDPPYYSPLSDNEYVRRYHFVEGLARDWDGVEIQEHTTTKKFKSYPTPFSTKNGAAEAFDRLFKKFSDSILIVSYSSNSLPTREEMIEIMKRYKANVEVIPIDYCYSFANQKGAKTNRNRVQEYLFLGY